MSRSASFWLAFRSFSRREKKKKGAHPLLGSILGISLSLIPLVVVIHISEGMVKGIMARFQETYTWHLQTYSFFDQSMDKIREQERKIASLENVRSTIIERQGFGIIAGAGGQSGVTIRALPPELYAEDDAFRSYIEIKEGKFDIDGRGKAMVGMHTAELLDLHPGDEVRIMTGKTFGEGRFVPKITKFTVTGIFTTGYQELDRLWVFLSLEDGLRILADDNAKTIIGIKTDDPYRDQSRLIADISRTLPAGWFVFTWQDLSGSYQKNYQTTKSILFVIMAMLVIVAVMNVASSLVMLVLERTQEIGILKCTGTSPREIRDTYLYIGLFVGILGAAGGIFAGTAFSLSINGILAGAENLVNAVWRLLVRVFSGADAASVKPIQLVNTAYYLESIPVVFQGLKVFVTGFCTVGLSVLAALLPAHKAGKIRPLDVIRKH